MSYDVTGLRSASQINVGLASDNEGVGFKLEMGWGWVIFICILGIAYAIFKYFNFHIA